MEISVAVLEAVEGIIVKSSKLKAMKLNRVY